MEGEDRKKIEDHHRTIYGSVQHNEEGLLKRVSDNRDRISAVEDSNEQKRLVTKTRIGMVIFLTTGVGGFVIARIFEYLNST